MEENYNVVPNIISSKDLDYLSDMFNWNYGAYKKLVDYSKNIKDLELKSMVDKVANSTHATMSQILNILGGSNE